MPTAAPKSVKDGRIPPLADELQPVVTLDARGSPAAPFLSHSLPLSHAGPYEILRVALARRTPQQVFASLTALVQNRPVEPDAISQLIAMLESTGDSFDDARKALVDPLQYHCHRCHTTYYAADDGINACILDHDPPERFRSGIIDYSIFPCCNKYEGPQSAECYRGMHAPKAASVDYSNSSAVECETNRCRFAKKGLAGPMR